jgi:2-C-methyl-D-erythritol 4-phosphate cytidylyltransferase
LKKFAIIVAGGSGLRMGATLPKQFLLLRGQPVLLHTLSRFMSAVPGIEIILVLPAGQKLYWEALWEKYGNHYPLTVVEGGEQRFFSVLNGLAAIDASLDEGIVGIHDGVRPLVSVETIRNAYLAAEIHGSAVPVVALNDSIRQVNQNQSQGIDRSHYRLVQTPQCFQLKLLREAYKADFQQHFTDDASVFEACGHQVFLTEGNPENIKITRQSDLVIAEALLRLEQQIQEDWI